MSQISDPTIITLDNNNSFKIMTQYIEVAQQKGAYKLNEAEILKRASDVLLNNVPDKEINHTSAKQLLIQGVARGQSHGSYTLNDAALLHKVVQFVSANIESADSPLQNEQSSTQEQFQPKQTDVDLSDLAEPIPLKPKEV